MATQIRHANNLAKLAERKAQTERSHAALADQTERLNCLIASAIPGVQAWNDPLGVGPERVKFAVMRLRRKLGQGPGEPGTRIEAVRGFGYRYVPPA